MLLFLIFLNEELDEIMKIVKGLEETSLLTKAIERIENEIKEKKGGSLRRLTAALGANLLENMLTDRGIKSKIPERKPTTPGLGAIPASEGTTRAGKGAANRNTKRNTKKIIKTNLNLTVFIQKIIYLN